MFWASSQDFNNQVLNPVKNFFSNTVPDALSSAWSWFTGGKSATEDPSQVYNPFHIVTGALGGVDNFFTGDRDFQRDLQKMEISNAFNAAEAQKQRDFEERMSNTAVSRRIADLKANGLNPYLAATDGASTPSGASAHSAIAGGGSYGGNVGALLGAFMNGAFNLARQAIATGAYSVANSERTSAYSAAWIARNEAYRDYLQSKLSKDNPLKDTYTRKYSKQFLDSLLTDIEDVHF